MLTRFKILPAIILAFTSNVYAQTTTYDYPELNVTPRASERVKMLALEEQKNPYKAHYALILASATTLAAGIQQGNDVDIVKDPDEVSGKVATVVGATWLLTGLALGKFYQPYREGFREAGKIKGEDKRSQLLRERLSEEAMDEAASLGRKITWLSSITMLGSNAYVLSKAKEESTARTVAAVGALVSLAPLIFPYKWIKTAQDHKDYKKKIYSPIVSAMVFNPFSQKVDSGLNLAWSF
jgi:hypothetical protein